MAEEIRGANHARFPSTSQKLARFLEHGVHRGFLSAMRGVRQETVLIVVATTTRPPRR